MRGQNKQGSLVWGVVFIVAGVTLLMQHMGYPISFWRMAARYWPLLLVLAGLGKIFDYYRSRTPAGLRFRDIGLVFVILIFGGFAALLARANLNPGLLKFPIRIGSRTVTVRDLFKNSYTYEDEGSHEIAADWPLLVDNTNGSVEITSGAVEVVKVRLKKVIYEDSENKAKEIAQRIRIVFDSEDKQLKIKTNWQDLEGPVSQCETSLFITVPRQTRCKVENRKGSVRIDGLAGDQDVYCTDGPVNVTDIRGALKVQNKYGNTSISGVTGHVEAICSKSLLSVTRVGGNVDVRNAFARSTISDVNGKIFIRDNESTLQIEDVKGETVIEAPQSSVTVRNTQGDVKIDADYNRPIRVEDIQANVTLKALNSYGPVVVQNVKGNVTLESKYGDLRVANIAGPLTITAESSSVQAENIKGVTRIQTTLKDVVVNAIEGQATIKNRVGDITLSPGLKLRGNLDITNENGKIDLVLPEDSSFNITAVARGGGVDSQFEGPKLNISHEGDEKISGSFGTGGPTIHLETTHKTITIRKGTEVEVRTPRETPRGKRKKSRRRSEIIVDQQQLERRMRDWPFNMRDRIPDFFKAGPSPAERDGRPIWRKQ